MKYIYIIFALLFSFSVFAAQTPAPTTANVKQSWRACTTRNGGTIPMLPGELAGYQMRYRLAGTATYKTIDVTPDTLSARAEALPFGTYEFQFSCYDKDGLVSEWTPAKRVQVQAAPTPPSYIKVSAVE